MKNASFKPKIPNGSLIISCQAEDNDPFNTPHGVSLFAVAAEMGGASAIRSEGISKTQMIIRKVKIPVIGLVKSKFPDDSVCITRKLRNIESLLRIGCNIIAIDGTERKIEGRTGPEFIEFVRCKFDCTIIADISKKDEAINCYNAGAHFLATTLSGYTPESQGRKDNGPDFTLVSELCKLNLLPVIAEGRIQNAEHVKTMFYKGAWAVVIGSAITRPRIVISNIIQQLSN